MHHVEERASTRRADVLHTSEDEARYYFKVFPFFPHPRAPACMISILSLHPLAWAIPAGSQMPHILANASFSLGATGCQKPVAHLVLQRE